MGGVEVFIGLPDKHMDRVAHNLYAYLQPQPEGQKPVVPAAPPRMSEFIPAVFMFSHLNPDYTTPEWLRIEMPAANGVCTARDLAKLYASLVSEVDGHRLYTDATVARATRQETKDGAIDRVILVPNRYGLGFSLYTPDSAMLGPTSFGHGGAGGIMAFADAEHEVGFAFGCNIMGDFERANALVNALRACLS